MHEAKTWPLPRPFEHESGAAWRSVLPEALQGHSGNTLTYPFQSRLVLLEEGRPMDGDRHAQLADIQAHGGGRHNHWRDLLYFAASDGSDPNTNGKTYSLGVAAPAPRVLALGTCHVTRALIAAAARGWIAAVTPYALSYNTRDTLNLIGGIRGERAPCATLPADLTSSQAGDLGPADLEGLAGVALEISSGLVVDYRGESLLRVGLHNRVVAPIKDIDEGLGKLAQQWLRHGLMNNREAIRADTAAHLVAALDGDPRLDPFVLEVMREARTLVQSPQEIADGVADILAAVAAPAVLFLHVVRFIPDGRPLTWPPGFHDLLREIAAGANMAVVDPPTTMAAQPPGATLLEQDLRYTRPMVDLMAREAVEGLGLPTSSP